MYKFLFVLFCLLERSSLIFIPNIDGSEGEVHSNNDFVLKGMNIREEILKLYDLVDQGARLDQVGDVKFSILDETTFQSLHGSCWVLMDGRELPDGNALKELTGMISLPNSNGRFFRSKDHGEGVDPAGELSPGSIQNFRTNYPGSVSTSSSGDHSHSVSSTDIGNIITGQGYSFGGNFVYHQAGASWTAWDHVGYQGGSSHTAVGDIYFQHKHDFDVPPHDHSLLNDNVDHSHNVNLVGDSETAPTYMVVNTFVKID